MITDSENEAIARSESVYRIGDIDQCRELEEKLDQKTDEIAALESMKDEEEIIENLEF